MSTISCKSPSFTPCSTWRKTRARRSSPSSRSDPRDGGETAWMGGPGSEYCHPEFLYQWAITPCFSCLATETEESPRHWDYPSHCTRPILDQLCSHRYYQR